MRSFVALCLWLVAAVSSPLPAQEAARAAGQVDFFPLPIKGERVVFVVDISGSMVPSRAPRNFEPITDYFTRAMKSMAPPQEFSIIVFAKDAYRFRSTDLSETATPTETYFKEAIKFLEKYDPGREAQKQLKHQRNVDWSGTVHQGTRADLALQAAFDLEPDTIYFLSDGEPSLERSKQITYKGADGKRVVVNDVPAILDYVKERQSESGGKVIINTVSYRAGGGRDFMSDLATQNGGTYEDFR